MVIRGSIGLAQCHHRHNFLRFLLPSWLALSSVDVCVVHECFAGNRIRTTSRQVSYRIFFFVLNGLNWEIGQESWRVELLVEADGLTKE